MRSISLLAGALAAAAPFATAAQPREMMSGGERVCVYPGPISATDRVVRVSVGQNCPATFIGDLSAVYPLPATARLRTEQVVGQARTCSYEQAGTTWWRIVPIERSCPISAGLLPPELRDPRR